MYVMNEPLTLASASPRRVEMLTNCGITFTKHPADIEEVVLEGETPQAMVERLAFEKGQAVSKKFPEAWILSADTTVAIGSEILNKPIDFEDSVRMLTLLAGNVHTVWGGITLCHGAKKKVITGSFASKVKMRPLEIKEIHAYISTGEPSDKAGSYAIQGIGASLVDAVEGSYTNVVGLHLTATIQMLLGHGVISIA